MRVSEKQIQVARRLVSLRALQGLTQEELASAAKVGRSSVVRAEQGRYSADIVVKLNSVFGTSLDYIFEGKGAP